jgi:tol-pal system protein YbgF
MRVQRLVAVVILTLVLFAGITPAWGVSREIIQLQTQVQALQDQMTRLQQSMDESLGIIKSLMNQNTDSINKVNAAMANLQTSLQKQQSDAGGHVDQVSGQIQALNDSLDELKARVAKVSKQLDDLQSAQQNLTTQQAQQQQQAQAPPPDVLYNNALRDYNAAKYDLATQEFSDYVKFYPTTDLAGNSYFYIADIAYRQGNFQQAVQNYDQVLQNFPGGNKAAPAELKKGFALIELGQKDDGVAALRHVIQRFPRSNEASLARERLQKLGVSTALSRQRRGEE